MFSQNIRSLRKALQLIKRELQPGGMLENTSIIYLQETGKGITHQAQLPHDFDAFCSPGPDKSNEGGKDPRKGGKEPAGVTILIRRPLADLVNLPLVRTDEDGRIIAVPIKRDARGTSHAWFIGIYGPCPTDRNVEF